MKMVRAKGSMEWGAATVRGMVAEMKRKAVGELGRALALGFGVECGGQRGCGCFPGENFRGPTLSARIGSSRRRDGECAVMMKNRRLGNRRSVRKSDGVVKRSLITLFSDSFFLISLTPGADPVLVSRGFKAVVSNVHT